MMETDASLMLFAAATMLIVFPLFVSFWFDREPPGAAANAERLHAAAKAARDRRRAES